MNWAYNHVMEEDLPPSRRTPPTDFPIKDDWAKFIPDPILLQWPDPPPKLESELGFLASTAWRINQYKQFGRYHGVLQTWDREMATPVRQFYHPDVVKLVGILNYKVPDVAKKMGVFIERNDDPDWPFEYMSQAYRNFRVKTNTFLDPHYYV